MFRQIEGLENGSIKPEQAKAVAQCGMVICKTVELDLRATDQLKDGKVMKSVELTSETVAIEHEPAGDDEELIDRIRKGKANGLSTELIAKRMKVTPVYVADVLGREVGTEPA